MIEDAWLFKIFSPLCNTGWLKTRKLFLYWSAWAAAVTPMLTLINGHFYRSVENSRSIFSITPNELKVILQSRNTISSPVTAIPGGQFVRVVDTGKNIGITSLKEGGTPTRYIKIFTDEMGNLITTYPVKGQ